MVLKKTNRNQIIILAANGVLIYSIILIFRIFISLYQSIFNLNNPIISQKLFFEINSNKVVCGIILSVGLILMISLKTIKQNFFIVIIGSLSIILYYLKIFDFI